MILLQDFSDVGYLRRFCGVSDVGVGERLHRHTACHGGTMVRRNTGH
jgi:hypothetical protein